MKRIAPAVLLLAGTVLAAPVSAATFFLPGNLVVSVEGNGVQGALSGPFTDNQAAPLSLFQFQTTGTSAATFVNSMALPQTASGANHAISGEYGSSSEGGLQLTGDGKNLVIMGYGVNAADFNANPSAFGPTDPTKPNALAQSSSAAVPRVVAVIGADGSVDTTTALTNVFNGNNPRSVASADGTTFYVSGQGTGSDHTAGVFYATKGATTATPITGDDTATNKGGPRNISQDTREVQIVNGQLVVSVDSKGGKDNARSFIGTVGTGLPTTTLNNNNMGETMLPGFGNSGGTGKVVLNANTANGISLAGQEINLSPEDFFFANSTTLYVADSGFSKNDSAATHLGDGGLQKWSLVNGTWVLDYTLSAGLNLVANTAAAGTTGLLGLTGEVIDGQVELFATNYTIGDTDPTFLYGITDDLNATTRPNGETFTQLAVAPPDSTFKGVAFAPTSGAVPEPSAYALMILGFGGLGGLLRRRRRLAAAA